MLYLPTIISLLVKYGPTAVQIAEIYGPAAVKFAEVIWPLIEQAISAHETERAKISAGLAAVGHPHPDYATDDFLTSRLSAMA